MAQTAMAMAVCAAAIEAEVLSCLQSQYLAGSTTLEQQFGMLGMTGRLAAVAQKLAGCSRVCCKMWNASVAVLLLAACCHARSHAAPAPAPDACVPRGEACNPITTDRATVSFYFEGTSNCCDRLYCVAPSFNNSDIAAFYGDGTVGLGYCEVWADFGALE